MTNKTVTVKLPNDADARPVAILVQIASKFESRIFIVDNNGVKFIPDVDYSAENRTFKVYSNVMVAGVIVIN